MARLLINQPHESLVQVKNVFNVVLPKPHDWRLLNPAIVGEINGLPRSRGVAIATNGILVAIKQNEDQLFIGHLEYFVPDEDSGAEGVIQSRLSPVSKKTTKTRKPKVDIEEFC